jgi:hypothetical protein
VIVQPGSEGALPLIIRMSEHTAFAGELARAWGNSTFAPLDPRGLMEYVIANHDAGWREVDAELHFDSETGLPFHLVQTPVPLLMRTGPGSAEFNGKEHTFCGLLASMHTYGLYTGRYGLSDMIFVDRVDPAHKQTVQNMLAGEEQRQQRMKRELAADPATAPWVQEERLFHAYKQLQFFDALALYFNMTPAAARGEANFLNVPKAVGDDVTVQIRPAKPGHYTLDPYPFGEDPLALVYSGRRLDAVTDADALPDAFEAAPLEHERVTLERVRLEDV